MRLGQLARKLELRTTVIVEFLNGKGIVVEEGSNTKLEDDQVLLVMERFAPTAKTDIVTALALEKKEEPVVVTVPSVEPAKTSDLVLPAEEPVVDEIKPEVIKAPKVELSGLKVLGKIELPESKKKATESSEGMKTPEAGSEPDKRRPVTSRPSKSPQRKERKTSIALQREQEALAREQKRAAQREQDKEQRTKNYHKRVKTAPPTKRVKLVEEPTEDMAAADMREAPRSLMGKFFRWLRT